MSANYRVLEVVKVKIKCFFTSFFLKLSQMNEGNNDFLLFCKDRTNQTKADFVNLLQIIHVLKKCTGVYRMTRT